jgi:hypothetical protein
MCNTTDSSLKTYNLNDIHLSLKMKMTLSIFFFLNFEVERTLVFANFLQFVDAVVSSTWPANLLLLPRCSKKL